MRKPLWMILCLVLVTASAARAWEFSEFTLVREITGYAGAGDFYGIHAVTLDESAGTLLVLAGPPLSLYAFSAAQGTALRRVVMDWDVPLPTALCRCRGVTAFFSTGLIQSMSDDGKRANAFKTTPDLPPAPSGALCPQFGSALLLWDATTNTLAGFKTLQTAPFRIPATDEGKSALGASPGQLADVAASSNGDIFILDTQPARVLKYSADGEFLQIIVDSTELIQPTLIAVDASGRIWVFDHGDMTLKVFENFGALRYKIASANDHGFVFIDPQWMRIDRDNRLFMHDAGTRSIKVFDVNTLKP
jgi:hypothetical protein